MYLLYRCFINYCCCVSDKKYSIHDILRYCHRGAAGYDGFGSRVGLVDIAS